MRVLDALEPKKVFYYFEEISKIPHGSGNTKKISDWIVDFAKKYHLKYIQDSLNNVIIIKEASEGYENEEAVIIQGHMDMVCEKAAGYEKNMEEEGIDLILEDDFISAEKTTLGGDDGIAVAMMLAILESDEIQHPKIEAIFTVDEEVGMLGAAEIDLSMITGKRLINIDSEDEGIFTVSCAGGNLTKSEIPVQRKDFNGEVLKIIVSGLKGGHSGVEINKGRANSNILMGRILYKISKGCELRLISINGGEKDNVIAQKTEALICVSSEEVVKKAVCDMQKSFKNEYCTVDPDIEIGIQKEEYLKPFDLESTKKIIGILNLMPNGVIEMSNDIQGLVQTSLNLGIVKTADNKVLTGSCVRSSKESQKQMLSEKIEILSKGFGGKVEVIGDYAGWEYKTKSDLRRLMTDVFSEQYGYEPKIEAIHAGLECGVLAAKIKDLDCISIGPNILDIHTPREKMSVSSVQRVWKMLIEALRRMKK